MMMILTCIKARVDGSRQVTMQLGMTQWEVIIRDHHLLKALMQMTNRGQQHLLQVTMQISSSWVRA